MTQLHPVTVKILDKEYHVGCPAAERAHLESAARYLDAKMQEIRSHGKVLGVERIAVLAALNISYEMLQAQPGNSGPERAPREQVGELLERIDQELHGADPTLRRQRHIPQPDQQRIQAPAPLENPVPQQQTTAEMPAPSPAGQDNGQFWQSSPQENWPHPQQSNCPPWEQH